MGQKLTNYTELVSYFHIYNVKCCVKSIFQIDDVSYASFCTLSNLGPVQPLSSLATPPMQYICLGNTSINSSKIHC